MDSPQPGLATITICIDPEAYERQAGRALDEDGLAVLGQAIVTEIMGASLDGRLKVAGFAGGGVKHSLGN